MIILDLDHSEWFGVLGLARTGLATIRCLLASNQCVMAWDDNPEALNVLRGQEFSGAIISGKLLIAPNIADAPRPASLVVSPGIGIMPPKTHPLVEVCIGHNVTLISDLDLLQRAQPHAKFIGITGTNGKSTTTSLVCHIMSKSGIKTEVGGNIGKPVLELEPLGIGGHYVLEVSSYQLERSRVHFDIAALINLSPDHLDRYDSFEAYVAAKTSIFDYQRPGDHAVVGHKCNDIYQHRGPATLFPNHVAGHCIPTLPYNKYLLGEHNRENSVIATSVCTILGLGHDGFQAIESFVGLPHRMEPIGQIGPLAFVNDSKATNADSCEKALMTYDDIYLIAGGICKDGGLSALTHLFYKLKRAYLIGDAAESFSEVLAQHNVPYEIVHTLEKSVEQIRSLNPTSGTVLLSPACASLDQWKNFEQRGNAFCRLVEEYWAL